jgi:gluconate 5-dehydrogenase
MNDALAALFSLDGRTALVTGGSRGLGLQCAEALGDAGARVIVTARKAVELEAAVAHLRGRGIDATWIAGDAAVPAEVERVAAEAVERLGRVDVLVNNAGATWGAPAEDYPVEAWDKVMDLNARGAFLFSREIARRSMIPCRDGRIVMMASIAGLAGNGPQLETAAYNASKAALINLARALAGEWGEHGITVNAIAPGFFPSRMTRGTLERLGAERLAARVPLRRLGGEEDLKGAVLLFAAPAGRHITGQVLAVDGGASCVLA